MGCIQKVGIYKSKQNLESTIIYFDIALGEVFFKRVF